MDDFSRFGDAAGPEAAGGDEERRPEELVELVVRVRLRGQLRGDVARLPVLTRAGGVPVDELAAVNEVHPQTMRQRHRRTSSGCDAACPGLVDTLIEVRVASRLRRHTLGTAPGRVRRFDERKTRREDSHGCCCVSPKR